MVALLSLFLNLLISPLKSTSRLEAENAALRQQLVVLQRKVRGRIQFAIGDRLFLHSAVSVISVGSQGDDDRPARDSRALASSWLSPLLALEIAGAGRAAASQCGAARFDPADEP
jgi:hypothetical protein